MLMAALAAGRYSPGTLRDFETHRTVAPAPGSSDWRRAATARAATARPGPAMSGRSVCWQAAPQRYPTRDVRPRHGP
jgi:hypothetical protein